MTVKTVKEWLNKGRKLDTELKQLREERKIALDLACSCTAACDNEKIQSSTKNTSDGKFAAYTEYSSMIDKKEFELLAYKSRMHNLINQLDNPSYRALLSLRYINCKTWEQIAEDMHYTTRNVHKIHGGALKLLSTITDYKNLS